MNDRDVCPVHNIKCEEWKETQRDMKGKLPIWVFKIAVTVLVIFLGSMNIYVTSKAIDLAASLETYIKATDKILKGMSITTREVSMNQRAIVKKLNMEYMEIPRYYGNSGDSK